MSDKCGLTKAVEALDQARYDIIGHWMHVAGGGPYLVTDHALRESDLEVVVLYVLADDDDAPVWMLPAKEFLQRFRRVAD
jgi:hypothetical protein